MSLLEQKAVWIGASGRAYTFHVLEIGSRMREVDGVYLYAKREGLEWRPVYIGQGNLADRCDLPKHHRLGCIRRKGATHIHAVVVPDGRQRLAWEDDLLAGNPLAYVPVGCNERSGG